MVYEENIENVIEKVQDKYIINFLFNGESYFQDD